MIGLCDMKTLYAARQISDSTGIINKIYEIEKIAEKNSIESILAVSNI